MDETANQIRRYTDLPALLYMLKNRAITLLDPRSWDDANDSYFLELYRKKMGFGSVLALCFTRSFETYHHWKVFSSGSGGIFVTFNRRKLLDTIKGMQGLRSGDITYKKIKELKTSSASKTDLPFLKRWPYRPEKEFRLIYECREKKKSLDIPIPLSCVERVTLSPWMNENVAVTVRKVVRSLEGCKKLSVVHTTLISNEQWRKYGDGAS